MHMRVSVCTYVCIYIHKFICMYIPSYIESKSLFVCRLARSLAAAQAPLQYVYVYKYV